MCGCFILFSFSFFSFFFHYHLSCLSTICLYSLRDFSSHRIRKGGKTTTFRVPDAKCIRNPCLPPLLAWYFLKLPSKSVGQQRVFFSFAKKAFSFFFFLFFLNLIEGQFLINTFRPNSSDNLWYMDMHTKPLQPCISDFFDSLFIYFLHFFSQFKFSRRSGNSLNKPKKQFENPAKKESNALLLFYLK